VAPTAVRGLRLACRAVDLRGPHGEACDEAEACGASRYKLPGCKMRTRMRVDRETRGVPQRHPGCANRILARGGENQETSRTIHVCPDTSVFDKARLRTVWRPTTEIKKGTMYRAPTEIRKGTMYRAPTGKKDPEHDPDLVGASSDLPRGLRRKREKRTKKIRGHDVSWPAVID